MDASRRAKAEEWQRVFGARIRELRLAKRLSQMDLADLADLHPTYVSSIERGKRNVSLVNIHVLAEALGVSVDDFWDATKDRRR